MYLEISARQTHKTPRMIDKISEQPICDTHNIIVLVHNHIAKKAEIELNDVINSKNKLTRKIKNINRYNDYI